MNKNNLPRACFKLDQSPDAKSHRRIGKLLAQTLGDGLTRRFGSMKFINAKIFPVWIVTVNIQHKPFALCVTKSRFMRDEWIIAIDFINGHFLWDRFLGRKILTPLFELKLLTYEIHKLLSEMPEVSDLRWYFDGSRQPAVAVANPAELNWS